jgi:hypothetical protein
MASTPHPPPKPAPRPTPPTHHPHEPPAPSKSGEDRLTPLKPGEDPQEAKLALDEPVKTYAKPEDDPNYVKTVGQEQLERSAEIQAMGVEAYMAKYSAKDPNEPAPKTVAGVGPLEHHENERRGAR